jgi:arginine repressor
VITKGDDFTVVIETSTGNTYVYGSVIDNTSSEARFVAAAIAGTPQPEQYGILVAHE